MDNLFQDLRYAIRTLRKRPGFTVVAALTLALGIGANTAIFSVVNGVLLRSLPYPDPDRVVMLWETNDRSRSVHISHPNFIDWREQSRSFEYISAYTGRWGGASTVLGGAEPERAYAVGVYRDFFKAMGVEPIAGRTFLPEESGFGTAPVVVVSYGFWQRQLGGALDLRGKKLTIGSANFDVIGVMPQGFTYPDKTDMWVSKEQVFEDTSSRTSHNYVGIARLKPGVTLEQAQADMDLITKQLEQQYPDDNKGVGAAVISLKDELVGSVRPALLVLLAAVGLVLLIACANVANLFLARALGRRKEIAIRAALGANRIHIIRQLLTESLVLSLLCGALGLLMAYWLVDLLLALSPDTIPRLDEIGIDNRTLMFTLGISLLTSLLFGLAPALKISRPDLQESLKEGGRTTSSGAGILRNSLVVAEVMLTMVLLISAGLLVKSFYRLLQVDPGFNPENLLTMELALPSSQYGEEHQRIAFHRELLGRIGSLPDVQAAGMINNLPMGEVNINGQFLIEGRPEEQAGYGGFRIINSDYFRAMNIPLIRGRGFTEEDHENSEPVAILSQRAAQRAFPDEDPIGKRIRSGMDRRYEVWTTIIGIVGDVRHLGLEKNATSELYVPYTQRPGRIGNMTLVVKTTGEPTAIVSAARSQVGQVDKNLPVSFEAMNQVFSRSVANRRYSMLLLGAFATLALLLALIGIYGVMSYAVSQNLREIGIRMALGAQASNILRLVIGQGLLLTLIGIGLGAAGAFGLTRLIESLLYGVSPTDTLTFISVSALLLIVAMLACYIPARRATKVDPMVALRYE